MTRSESAEYAEVLTDALVLIDGLLYNVTESQRKEPTSDRLRLIEHLSSVDGRLRLAVREIV